MSQETSKGIYITQEDIDTALQAARRPEEMFDADDGNPLFLNEADIVDSVLEGDSEEEDFFGLLAREDIEALLHGDLDGSSGREAQDDIDTLFQTTSSAKDTPETSEEEVLPEKNNTAQEEVERLIQEAGEGVDAPEGGETKEKVETEAPDEGAAVSQDDIDRLLMGALDDSGDETGDAGESDSLETGEMLSQDDLDSLLSDASEDDGREVEPDFSETASVEPEVTPVIQDDAGSIEPEVAAEPRDDTESLISQSDLDQLLGGGPKDSGVDSPSSDPKSQSDHISQDDINRLLKESIDEAEDLLDEEADSADESDSQEPVILASEEEADSSPGPVLKPAPAEKIWKATGGDERKKRIWENRRVWAAAAGVVLFVTITAMVMSSGPTETVPQPKVLTFSLNQTGDDSPGAPPLSETSIRLSGFVVLAPPNSAAVTYVTADLTLDFSDAAVVAVIKENEAVVRDIIYGTISSELMTRDISAIDEISLELAIRKALGRVVAREAIGRIKFDRFSLM